MSGQVARTRGGAQAAANSEWFERLGRLGLAAKGLLYATIAVLALQVALPGGEGGQTTGQQGAIATLARQPFGTAVLVVLAAGLVAYALWRLVQAAVGTGKDEGAKEVAKRVGYLLVAVVYLGLAVLTVRTLAGSGGGGGGGEQELTARVLGLPFGVALVVLAGLVIAGVGVYQGYRGITQKFREDLRIGRMSPSERTAITRLGTAGLLARGVVFVMIGAFLIRAALSYDPSQATGLDGALAALAGSAPWLLGVVALGLAAYAVYCFALVRYGRIRQAD
jgi:hypothetical protein